MEHIVVVSPPKNVSKGTNTKKESWFWLVSRCVNLRILTFPICIFFSPGFCESMAKIHTTMLFQQVWPILVLTKSTHLISQFFNQKKSSWYHVGWVTHAIPVIHLDRRNPNLSSDSRHLDQTKRCASSRRVVRCLGLRSIEIAVPYVQTAKLFGCSWPFGWRNTDVFFLKSLNMRGVGGIWLLNLFEILKYRQMGQ